MSRRNKYVPANYLTVRMRGVCCGLICLLCSLVTGTTVSAAPVSFVFTGTVTSVTLDFDPFGGSVRVGSPFSGKVTFDDVAVDQRPDRPKVGSYYLTDGRSGFEVTLGGMTFTSRSVTIQVNNLDTDSYFVYADTPFTGPSSTRVEVFAFELTQGPASIFQNDSLPLTPPDLTAFKKKEFGLIVSGGDGKHIPASISGQIDTLTLAPKGP